tara:strand:- start:180 stop:842 length:663 start_codon:yes stop_codon:yes gene_type:complete
MGGAAGPDIVTKGLILALDAADPNSYPGNGNTWTDLSLQSNNATLAGNQSFSTDFFGSLSFTTSGAWGIVDNTSILPTDAYTKVAWFKPDSSTANIISGGNDDGKHAFWLGSTNDTLKAGHNGSWNLVEYNAGNMTGKWNFGAVTFNTTTGYVLYYNGEQVDTDSNTTTFINGNTVRIGAYGDNSNRFNGDINIAMIYNRVLTPSEVQQNYNATKNRFGL